MSEFIKSDGYVNNCLYEKYKYHCNNYKLIYEDMDGEHYSLGSRITRKDYIILLCGFLCECLRKYKLNDDIESHIIYTHLIDLCDEGADEFYRILYSHAHVRYIDDVTQKDNKIDEINNRVKILRKEFLEKLTTLKEKYLLT